ncbi:MAG TPA: hypothetical protein VGV35_06815 [Bryobacteraceae bacterium]|nr:hypothetical protein [Bryobacteraceae bacterium]
MKNSIFLFASILLLASVAVAQDQRVVVTVEGRKDAAPPAMARDDVMVSVENQRARVTGWKPVRTIGTDLWLLIDDGTNTDVSLQFDDLRKFILNQPSTTNIGIGYLRNGSVTAAQTLTADHASAAKALRIPTATPGISASPYLALIELIHKWPATDHAREVLMITSGIDPDNGPGPINPYLTRAIDTAQRAGVVVSSIYYGSAGNFGHSLWQINWGQNFLAQISEETGGEFYWQGNLNPVSFTPYLNEIHQHLNNQYLVSFQPPPQNSPGYKKLKVTTEIPHATLVTQSRIYEGNK